MVREKGTENVVIIDHCCLAAERVRCAVCGGEVTSPAASTDSMRQHRAAVRCWLSPLPRAIAGCRGDQGAGSRDKLHCVAI